MSSYTTVMLSYSGSGSLDKYMERINEWVMSSGRQNYGFSGNILHDKSIPGALYCAEFNYFDVDAFVTFLSSLDFPIMGQEEIQVFYRHNGNSFAITNVF